MAEEEAADPPMHDLKSKGLQKGSVSLVGAVSIGLAATAPAYSLTGALGHGAAEAGYQLPVVFIIAVVPMFFVALAYKHLTDAAPDAGTVFTWGSKAIRPHIGWIGGYALLLSSVLAGVGAAGITVNAITTALGLENSSNWVQMGIAAAFISHKLQEGAKLGEAMEATLTDLDGFFTFVVGTKNGFGVVRDPIACKPAVMAETDQYVAFGSEYRAMVNLPGIDSARVWEPEPATVYFWER